MPPSLHTRFAAAVLIIALPLLAGARSQTPGAGLPTTTWPAGTRLAEFPHGGRITTFHRGMLYLGGTDLQQTWLYDIRDPRAPALRCSAASEGNSHVWYKIGDLFYRQNLIDWGRTPPRFRDFSNLAQLGSTPCAWTEWNWTAQPIHDFPGAGARLGADFWISTYPYAYGYTEYTLDPASGWWPPAFGENAPRRDLAATCGVQAGNRFSIGNLLFFTPGDGQNGLCVFDIGDPALPRLLRTLPGNYRQYTTAWHVWRHYLVLMNGDDGNGPLEPRGNAVVVDFSDLMDGDASTEMPVAWTIPRAPRAGAPLDYLPGRYVHFQDDYAFAGHVADGRGGGHGVKYDMVNRRVVQTFDPSNTGTDFQWIPLGHLLVVSGSEQNGSATAIFAHQSTLDRTPPSIGYHLPVNGATRQPPATAIGLVINEQLDATTVNEQTIQLRRVDGAPVPAVVMHTSYDVVNVVPVQALAADTSYEVRIVADGVRDVAGNAMAPYSFFFSTGDELALAPEIEAVSVDANPATAGRLLNFSASVRRASTYRWSAGDGTNPSGWSATPAWSHRYTRPGVHVAQLEARNDTGQTATAALRVVVNPEAATPAPAASTSIAVAHDSVWVVNPDHDSVAVFDAATRMRRALHAVCDDPRSLARDAAGRWWIACRGDDRVIALQPDGVRLSALDLVTGYGSAPSALLFDAAGENGFVALGGSGELLRFRAADAQVTARVSVGFQVESLARAGTWLYAARLASADDAGRIASIDALTFAPRGGERGLPGIALALDRETPDAGTAGRGLPNYVAALAPSPDASRLWYAAKKDNILRGLTREGTELDFEKTTRVLIGGIDTGTGTELAALRRDVDNSALALALAPSPGGALLFVALAGNDRVVALDPWNGSEIARVDVGAAPRGLAVDAARDRLWVRNDLGRSVSVIDIAALGTGTDATLALLGTFASVADEVLAAPVLAGKRMFWRAEDTRMSADGYLSCASCHLDGGSDGRVWDFTQRGEGLRRTTTMNGRAGMAHGPVHWSANFDEIQDFEHDIREAFGGGGFMRDERFFEATRDRPLGTPKAGVSAELDALAAYAASLDRVGRSPHRVDAATLRDSAAQGRQLFGTLGCARCHGGSAFSDSALRRWHDVGTLMPGEMRAGRPLQGIDTPTLRGLWRETRLLHDGRAPDPLAAIEASPRHAATATLSPQQRLQLRDYLWSIDDAEPDATPPFALRLSAPQPGETADPGRPLRVTIDTDLSELVRIEVLLDGEAVAQLAAPPWQADIALTAGTRPELQLRVLHASGAITHTWPQRIDVHPRAGGVFRSGFEAAQP